MSKKEHVSSERAAKLLGISVSTAKRMYDGKLLRGFRMPRGKYRRYFLWSVRKVAKKSGIEIKNGKGKR